MFSDPRFPPFDGLSFSLVPGESRAPYRRLLSASSVANARRCYYEHARALEAAERRHGVPAGVVAAIVYVESACGRNTGSSRILPLFFDGNAPALLVAVTLADTPRSRLGALLFELPIDGITEVLRSARAGESFESYAIDHRGRMVSDSRFKQQLTAAGLLPANAPSTVLRVEVRDPGGDLTAGFEPDQPRVGGVALDLYSLVFGVVPHLEAGRARRGENPPGRGDRVGGCRAAHEQAREQLEEHQRLTVGAHRAERVARRAVGARHERGAERVRWPPARAVFGRVSVAE